MPLTVLSAAATTRATPLSPVFTGLDESRLKARDALGREIGLKHSENPTSQQHVAIGAGCMGVLQVVAEDKMRVGRKLGETQRMAQLSEVAATRNAVEAELGTLLDAESPSKRVASAKLERINKAACRLKT